MTSRPMLVLLVLAAFAAVGLYLFNGRDDSLSRLHREGVIRIGYAVEPPYAFLTPGGEVAGEAPEIARRVAASLAIPRVEWRQVEFSGLIDELEAGRIDVIAAGMFITGERARRVRFSIPTFHVRPGLLVARENPKGIRSLRQAVSADDVRLAILAGAVEEQLLRRLGVTDARLVVAPDARTGRQAVESGLADVLVLSEPTVAWMATRDGLGRTERLAAEADEAYGRVAFAFRRTDSALADAWNRILAAYLGGPEHLALLARLGLSATQVATSSVSTGGTP